VADRPIRSTWPRRRLGGDDTVVASTLKPILLDAQEAADAANRAVREARAQRLRAVFNARAEGLTLTEIADILGVSYQRVWQIASTNRPAEQS
jgi:DNA-directed RNA polymerase specialized sigma24 family protein